MDSFKKALESFFPEAMVADFEHLEPALTNDPKDRHVLAAAIKAHAAAVVTFNLKDFPDEALEPCGIKAVHPSDYLTALYSINPGLVVARITEMAASVGIEPVEILRRLAKSVPLFAGSVADALGWDLEGD